MPSRIAQLASSPLLTQFAVTASQRAVRKIGAFLFPLCEVPDLNFRYKVYDDKNRYRIPSTLRAPGSPATVIGFSATDAYAELQPNALDFPVPNAEGLSDEALQWSIMEGQSTLADVSALALEQQQVSLAVNALTGAAVDFQYSNNANDPIGDATYGLDTIILNVIKAAKNGAPIKILFGASAFKLFRNNALVRGRFVVGSGRGAVGLVSPTVGDITNLLMTNPQIELSTMVQDTSAQGQAAAISFLLDNAVIVFASNDAPNRMDVSFGKTFARMGGFFKAGSYTTQDQRDEVLKMDWTTLPLVTNSAAAQMIITS
jgi:hypothetical protein